MTRPRQPARSRRGRKPERQSRWPFVAAGAAVLTVVAAIGFMEFTGSDADQGTAPTPSPGADQARDTGTQTAARDLSNRAGGLSEGAISMAADPPQPPPGDLRANGGRRFYLPLKAHAGVEDYFGTPRLYGQVHGGVDFSLAGLGEIPVYSACTGVVAAVEQSATLGTHVVVDCGDGWSFVAGFLADVGVRPGDQAGLETVIGDGSPGGHLHVELRYDDSAVDPEGYLDLPRKVIPPTATPTSTPGPTRTATPVRPTSTPLAGAPPASPTTSGPPPTATATPTVTPTPTITPTPTWTPTPSPTRPRAAATPTPLPRIQ